MKSLSPPITIDAKWYANAQEFPEIAIARSIREMAGELHYRANFFERQNPLNLECWIGALSSASKDSVAIYVDHCLVSRVDDDLKEQSCFLGTAVGSAIALEHLYRQVLIAFEQSETRRVNLSRFLEALYLSSERTFPDISKSCERFVANRTQSLESRASAEAAILANRGDFSGLIQKIKDNRSDGLSCRYYINKLALNEIAAKQCLIHFDRLSIPNQIAMIETLCATPRKWVLELILDVLQRPERSGWFRSAQSSMLNECAIRCLELFSDSQSEQLLRETAATTSPLARVARVVLVQRFPRNHGLCREFIDQCVSDIEMNLSVFSVGSPAAKARVEMRQKRALVALSK